MKSIKQGKIILDRNMKYFRGITDKSIDSLDEILPSDLFPIECSDEDIVSEFDTNYRKNIDVWKIEIIIKTKS
jgi:hypothetical protein